VTSCRRIVDHNLGLEGKEKEVDLYRDTWVRYFGYFNEVRASRWSQRSLVLFSKILFEPGFIR
jgi:hypothetical protein